MQVQAGDRLKAIRGRKPWPRPLLIPPELWARQSPKPPSAERKKEEMTQVKQEALQDDQ